MKAAPKDQLGGCCQCECFLLSAGRSAISKKLIYSVGHQTNVYPGCPACWAQCQTPGTQGKGEECSPASMGLTVPVGRHGITAVSGAECSGVSRGGEKGDSR